MTTYLTHRMVLLLHEDRLQDSGGQPGVRDPGMIESAVAQPQMTFGGEELYESLGEKAAALCFSLVSNHGFVDGNKRVGHAAMEVFLRLNGWSAGRDQLELERVILALAAGTMARGELAAWVQDHLVPWQL